MAEANLFNNGLHRSFSRDIVLHSLLFFALCAPLILFNGHEWFHVTMLYKWLAAFLPVAYLAGFIGVLLLSGRSEWRVDSFSVASLCLLMLFPLQILLSPLKNPVDWLRSWLFVSSLGGAYLVFLNMFKIRYLPTVLRCLLAAGALSTLFGFIQQADMSKGVLFILDSPLPDRFLANTGVDNILGVVLALSSFSGVWLLSNSIRCNNRENGPTNYTRLFFFLYDIPMIAVNLTGLWKTGTRASMLALLCATVTLLMLRRFTKEHPSHSSARSIFLKRVLPLLVVSVLLLSLLPQLLPVQRRDIQTDLSIEALSPAREGRFAIWAVTFEMIRKNLIFGVGLGNYKWNYLDSLPAFYRNWDLKMHYSFWAHNEYLQWTAETGVIGALLTIGLLLLWIRVLVRRLTEGDITNSTIWGICALVIFAIDALFSRPFHHAESAIWIPLAFAVINAEVLPDIRATRPFRAFFGGVVAAIAVFGIFITVQSLPAERRFAWIGHSNSFFLVSGNEQIQLPVAPLLLRDIAKEVRWNQSLTRARLEGKTEFFREASYHLEADYATRPRFALLSSLVKIHMKLGNTERYKQLLNLLPPEDTQEIILHKQ